jgi:hypothetical protein
MLVFLMGHMGCKSAYCKRKQPKYGKVLDERFPKPNNKPNNPNVSAQPITCVQKRLKPNASIPVIMLSTLMILKIPA